MNFHIVILAGGYVGWRLTPNHCLVLMLSWRQALLHLYIRVTRSNYLASLRISLRSYLAPRRQFGLTG